MSYATRNGSAKEIPDSARPAHAIGPAHRLCSSQYRRSSTPSRTRPRSSEGGTSRSSGISSRTRAKSATLVTRTRNRIRVSWTRCTSHASPGSQSMRLASDCNSPCPVRGAAHTVTAHRDFGGCRSRPRERVLLNRVRRDPAPCRCDPFGGSRTPAIVGHLATAADDASVERRSQCSSAASSFAAIPTTRVAPRRRPLRSRLKVQIARKGLVIPRRFKPRDAQY